MGMEKDETKSKNSENMTKSHVHMHCRIVPKKLLCRKKFMVTPITNFSQRFFFSFIQNSNTKL